LSIRVFLLTLFPTSTSVNHTEPDHNKPVPEVLDTPHLQTPNIEPSSQKNYSGISIPDPFVKAPERFTVNIEILSHIQLLITIKIFRNLLTIAMQNQPLSPEPRFRSSINLPQTQDLKYVVLRYRPLFPEYLLHVATLVILISGPSKDLPASR